MEKTPEGQINAIENNVINIDKIKFLNHIKDRTAREQDQQLGKWYTNLVQSIRSSTLKICEQQDQLLCRTECSKIEHKLNTIYTEEQAFS